MRLWGSVVALLVVLAVTAMFLVRNGNTERTERDQNKSAGNYAALFQNPEALTNDALGELLRRALYYSKHYRYDEAVLSCSAALRMKGITAEEAGAALSIRAYCYHMQNRHDEAIADCTLVVHNTKSSKKLITRSLQIRSDIYGDIGKLNEAITDCTAILQMRGISADILGKALLQRGNWHGMQNQYDKLLPIIPI